ncbi:MAG: rod shape-determining protein RodA [Omnitrophica bacterium RIFCSPLOWO2_02_FULL_45_16]|nr:MAG: rod shape-determining protein RodA [Omnitrophica bacterium RIFCSPHIGHO2_02_FULL_46_20]OGW94301.1 MAG: rod shape-determining protein RodA [Omnitrophica bacterium RIFCSPLOWO2_12_FULL_45_13]OGW94513.1 MAG: rod shape-determining protein RodA [Omnitrophica bacterium RIFCSPLOWO2_01_FULL_45_24]OGW99991.1 MAG: rod shape-determining protein RodA [Omnitrophica bacterium RIFCSPLOWO2_02_FULL_45_16]
MIFDKRLVKDFDKALLVITFILCLGGVLMLHSATQAKGLIFIESYVFRQINWIVLAAAFLLIVINISYQKFIDISYALYAINIVLLMLVLILGRERLGAQRWFTVGNFAFQPSEFIKINFILTLANLLGSKKGRLEDAKMFFIPLVLLAIPFLLVLVQPDLGTALLLIPIFLAMAYVGGMRVKHLLILVIIGISALPFFWHFLKDYQKQRLLVFLNPNVDPLGAGYTIIQSKIAVGSGGLTGKGWLAGTQNQLNFLPERHTDFIFSVIGEEWGLFGALILILLYFLITRRGFDIVSSTNDMYGKLVAVGIVVLISLQVVINIAMTIGLMPVVGIPLPLVSYGGSSMLATFIAIGLLLNIGMRRSRF